MRFVASRAPFPIHRLLLAAAAVACGAAFAGGPASAAAPTLTGAGVDVSAFSPDADALQDSVRYSYTLGGDAAVVLVEVWQGDAVAPIGPVVRTLRNESRTPEVGRVTWDGKDGGGTLQPDAYYWFVATATNPDGSAAAVPVRVELDTVSPQVSVVSVANPYAPGAEGADTLARVTVNLTDVAPGDRLTVYFNGPRPLTQEHTANFTLSAGGIFEATWAGGSNQDGLYAVRARVFDDAGHSQQASGPDLNLDAETPAVRILSPARSDTSGLIRHVEAAVSDRSGLGFVRITVSSVGGAVADSLCPCPAESVGVGIDVPDPVATADSMLVTIFTRDTPGQEFTFTQFLYFDTLPPPPPGVDSRPARTVLSNLNVAGTSLESDSVYVRVNGGLATRVRVSNNTRYSATVFLPLGTSTVEVLARDVAANFSAATAWQVLFEQPLGVRVPENFRAGNIIEVILQSAGRGVEVRIYTLSGRLVRTLESTAQSAIYQIPWDLRDEDGGTAGSGPYIFRVVATQQDGTTLESRVAAVVTQ